MAARRTSKYDGPEFIVSREFFDRYFEQPLPQSTFHDLVNRGCIVPWGEMRGKFLLNASLSRMKLPVVNELPAEKSTQSLEDITRLAFTFLDPVLFPAPSWLLGEQVIDTVVCNHASCIAERHRTELEMYLSPQEKLSYFAGVLDASYLMDQEL